MPTPLSSDLAQARTDWLAGDPDAWARYLACLRVVSTRQAKRDRPRQTRRTRRIRRLRVLRAHA